MRLRTLSLALSLILALPVAAQTQVRAVTLSSAGLALIEANGVLTPEGLNLEVRRDHIDDFLKSLRVFDPAAAVPQLTLTGPGGVEDVFSGLPFGPEALSSLRVLIDAMTGAPVSVERRGVMLTGRLMGSRDIGCAEQTQTACVAMSLRTDDGTIAQVLMDEAASVKFLDEADQAALQRGLAALRASATAQQLAVRISSSDATARELTLGWLQSVPQWKTAWRAEDGADGLVLTGWAVLENATGQDWDKVDLTLATGAVQALRAQLYERTPVARKRAAPQARAASAMPTAVDSMMLSAEADFAAVPVAMDDGESFSRFTLATPVSLAAGDMMSVPFLSENLTDARLTLYRGGSAAIHPMIALKVTNPLPLRLPAGVLTLYESGRGHAGDAMMPELAPGASEIVEFARDTALRIDEQVSIDQRLHSLRIVDGLLVSEDWQERRTLYRIQGPEDRARQLTIAHPLSRGWEVLSPAGEAGLSDVRYSVAVPAGSITEHEVVERRLRESRFALLDLAVDQLAFWQGRAPDAKTRDLFASLQRLRVEEARLKAELQGLRDAETQLIADQQRLAGLIVQLGDDSVATRERRLRVDAIDAEIESGRQTIKRLEARLAQVGQELRQLVLRGG